MSAGGAFASLLVYSRSRRCWSWLFTSARVAEVEGVAERLHEFADVPVLIVRTRSGRLSVLHAALDAFERNWSDVEGELGEVFDFDAERELGRYDRFN